MAEANLSAERLRELFHYDPETGAFTWKVCPSLRVAAGSIAGCLQPTGYIRIKIDGQKVMAHRAAWCYMTGEWPTEIDHRNADRSDNRFSNLRECTRALNSQNRRKASAGSKSGLLGVVESINRSGTARWVARIRVGGKTKYLGSFSSAQLAHDAYVSAKRAIHPFCTL